MLTWNEIRARCAAFAERWAQACDEDAEAKSFGDELFTCFGANRRQVASFEAPVRMHNGNLGYIDLLWKGKLVVEHKSRAHFPGSTLADLFDPNAMPPALAKAHEQLDRAVDRCYRPEPFTSERQRVEFLFALYEQLAAPLAKQVILPKPQAEKHPLSTAP